MKENTFSVSINGLTAICFQRPDMRPPQGVKIDHEDWEKENWGNKLYRNSDGKVIVPIKLIRKSLIIACRFTDLKPGGKLRSFRPFVESCMLIENDGLLEYDEKKNPKAWLDYPTRGNGKMPVYRPIIEMPWSFGIRVSCFDASLKKAVVEDLFEIAGRVCGLGEARNYMGYGRFAAVVTPV
jgi:hypothetical protein